MSPNPISMEGPEHSARRDHRIRLRFDTALDNRQEKQARHQKIRCPASSASSIVKTHRTMSPGSTKCTPLTFLDFLIQPGVKIGADRDPVRMRLCVEKSLAWRISTRVPVRSFFTALVRGRPQTVGPVARVPAAKIEAVIVDALPGTSDPMHPAMTRS
jgi:hypothetical protein